MSGTSRVEMIAGYRLEIATVRDGVLIRTPGIFPVNAREWHGPYADEVAALVDFRTRVARPRITPERLRQYRNHGYYGIVRGVEVIQRRSPWTGASELTPFELVEA
ncbi:hypothetical protein [Komagataeibacter sp. FNDCR2]|uniref:hypothetical protein n=1 Tax=Komagataeibacter sp. FNDCR2 TaxID=2878682 RepID=UPI001E2B3949|nr:hypothetical protein [Komagataeibacter sp. FNDCR2]MCE2576720.1 hypothetical protein [Komagataeibacter sp. FNDCR2]